MPNSELFEQDGVPQGLQVLLRLGGDGGREAAGGGGGGGAWPAEVGERWDFEKWTSKGEEGASEEGSGGDGDGKECLRRSTSGGHRCSSPSFRI